MNQMTRKLARRSIHEGFSLLEVLVSIVILAIGLLGLAGLQAKANEVEMEAYQRAVALMLVQDMADRIAAGRKNVAAFQAVSEEVYGTNDKLSRTCTGGADAAGALCEWSKSMKGEAERTSAGSIGAPIGMRGCLISVAPTESALGEFFVVGVWQGITPSASPPANTPGAQCADDVDFGAGLRRAAVVRVLIPKHAAG